MKMQIAWEIASDGFALTFFLRSQAHRAKAPEIRR